MIYALCSWQIDVNLRQLLLLSHPLLPFVESLGELAHQAVYAFLQSDSLACLLACMRIEHQQAFLD